MYARKPAILTCALFFSLGLMTSQALSADTPAVTMATAGASLRLHSRTELPGYTGDFDHFAVDVKGNRLFLAAEDHGTLEVFDLASGEHLKTIEGVEVPHGILYLEDKNLLIVTDSGAGFSKVFDATTYKVIDTIKLAPGADSMGYDAGGKHLYVATGGKNGNMADSFLTKIDPRTRKQLGELKFETDKVEAMAIEQKGKHLYINVTGKNHVAVIDKEKFVVLNTWPIKEAEMNAAMAFDEANQRLFVVTRKPFKLLILNARTGASIASFAAPERTNEAIFDKVNRRIYLAGDDFISVFQQKDADHYEELAHVPSAKGAKTAIFVPELNRLYAAISPGEGKTGAAVLRFDVAPASIAAK
jgi:DNA-binding beta-propeller fold protein YncE